VAPFENAAVGLVATGATDHHFLAVDQELRPAFAFFGRTPVDVRGATSKMASSSTRRSASVSKATVGERSTTTLSGRSDRRASPVRPRRSAVDLSRRGGRTLVGGEVLDNHRRSRDTLKARW